MFGLGSLFRREAAAIRLMQTSDSVSAARLHAMSFARGWSEEEIAALILDRQVEALAQADGGAGHGDGGKEPAPRRRGKDEGAIVGEGDLLHERGGGEEGQSDAPVAHGPRLRGNWSR